MVFEYHEKSVLVLPLTKTHQILFEIFLFKNVINISLYLHIFVAKSLHIPEDGAHMQFFVNNGIFFWLFLAVYIVGERTILSNNNKGVENIYVYNGCLHVGHGSPHYTADRVGGVGGPRATFFFT